MTTQQLNTADSPIAAGAMQAMVAAGTVGGSDLLVAVASEPAGDEKDPSAEIPQKPAKGAGKGAAKGANKGAGKAPDDRGPAPPLPKPLATFNL